METLTITRLGEPKIINYTSKKTGKPDSFNKVGFQSSEYGDRWFDFTFRGNHGLSVGQKLECETSSRDYNGKTYWDAKMPKRDSNTGGDKFGTSAAEIKNLITLKLEPLMERNNAGIQKLEAMLNTIEGQVATLIKQQVDEEPDEMSDFDRAIDDPES